MATRKNRPFSVEQMWKPMLDLIEKSRQRRGKTMAKQGEVAKVWYEQQRLFARVKSAGYGGGIYAVELPVQNHWEPYLDQVATWFARRPDWLATCLSGIWDETLLEFIRSSGLHLFPNELDSEKQKWEAKCSCQDWEPFCKHIAAVLYYVIGQIEQFPLQAFAYVGLSTQTLLDQIHLKTALWEIESNTNETVSEWDRQRCSRQNEIWEEEKILLTKIKNMELVQKENFIALYDQQKINHFRPHYMA